MKKINYLFVGSVTVLLLSGCGYGAQNTENEALRQQVAQLESQVAQLQAQSGNSQAAFPQDQVSPQDQDAQASSESTQVPSESTQVPSESAQAPSESTQATGSDRMEELSALVEDFVTKSDSLISSKSAPDLEQFFTFKKDAAAIDQQLDNYEDELEGQYRKGALSGTDYKELERELEKLEDSLDNAEDRLEIFFGIDD